MLAVPSPLPRDGQGFAFEYKWDGMRAIVAIRKGVLLVWSRNGLEQSARFPELAAMARQTGGHDVVLDGEIVAFDAKGRPDFGRLQNRFGLKDSADIRRQAQAHPVHFLAFDLLELDGRDVLRRPYRERRRLLEGMHFQGPNWATTPSHVGEGEAMLEASRDLGLEGVMAKRLDSPYVPGNRSASWLKVRNRNRQEFVVGGWSRGEGSRRMAFGALLVGCHRVGGKAGKLRYLGRVGSGYRDEDLVRLLARLKALASTKSPFQSEVDREDDVRFVQPRLVVEVEFNGLTRNGLLRQPAFKGLRTDKDPKDVVWEQVEGLLELT